MLIKSGEMRHFDQGVLLLNGVVGKHLDYVNHFLAQDHPIPWDTVTGPRGRQVLYLCRGTERLGSRPIEEVLL